MLGDARISTNLVVQHAAIQRDIRCVLAYLYVRLDAVGTVQPHIWSSDSQPGFLHERCKATARDLGTTARRLVTYFGRCKVNAVWEKYRVNARDLK